jgi:hypothetical protein
LRARPQDAGKPLSLTRIGTLMVTGLLISMGTILPGQAWTSGENNPPLASVGRLLVPALRYRDGYAEHFDERCSATLVAASAGATHSRLLLSAWHCVEDYRDLSRPLVFESAEGDRSRANILVSGGGMHSDWVLLRLMDTLPGPASLGREPIARSGTVPAMPLQDMPLLMAGYPRESHGPGSTLETAGNCRIIGMDNADARSNCIIQKGASGGAVFSGAEDHRYLGVISRGDGESESIFVPLERFHRSITPYLGDYYPESPAQ